MSFKLSPKTKKLMFVGGVATFFLAITSFSISLLSLSTNYEIFVADLDEKLVSPSPIPTGTAVPSTTPTPTFTPRPSPSPTPKGTPVPSTTPTPTFTPRPSPKASLSPTPTSIPSSSPIATSTSTPESSPTVKEKNKLEVSYPKEMDLEGTATVKLSIIRTSEEISVARVETEGRIFETTLPNVPKPTGTPGVPLKDAFGPDYEAKAKAKLVASTADVRGDDEFQSLEPQEVRWQWYITPKQDKDESFFITMLVEWKHKNSDRKIERRIRTEDLTIEVNNSILDFGKFDPTTLIIGLIGSGLSFPWLYERYKEWRDKRNQKPRQPVGFVAPSSDSQAASLKKKNLE
jgi:hypothetical protein